MPYGTKKRVCRLRAGMGIKNISIRKKPTVKNSRLLKRVQIERKLFSVRFFKGSDASRANVCVDFLIVFDVRNFLYVYLKRSSRLTVGVADVVTGCLTFPANIAYSRHIKHLRFGLFFLKFFRKNGVCKTRI